MHQVALCATVRWGLNVLWRGIYLIDDGQKLYMSFDHCARAFYMHCSSRFCGHRGGEFHPWESPMPQNTLGQDDLLCCTNARPVRPPEGIQNRQRLHIPTWCERPHVRWVERTETVPIQVCGTNKLSVGNDSFYCITLIASLFPRYVLHTLYTLTYPIQHRVITEARLTFMHRCILRLMSLPCLSCDMVAQHNIWSNSRDQPGFPVPYQSTQLSISGLYHRINFYHYRMPYFDSQVNHPSIYGQPSSNHTSAPAGCYGHTTIGTKRPPIVYLQHHSPFLFRNHSPFLFEDSLALPTPFEERFVVWPRKDSSKRSSRNT